jgi:hypothetical protein
MPERWRTWMTMMRTLYIHAPGVLLFFYLILRLIIIIMVEDQWGHLVHGCTFITINIIIIMLIVM